MNAQHSLGWFRDRLGKITGSQVGLIMKSGKNSDFTDTAKNYLYQVLAERNMNPAIVNDDEIFEEYIQQVDVKSKAMQWGNDQEENARNLYTTLTKRHIVEVGSCLHPAIPNFASSPDGFYHEDETGCIEIKCPNQSTYQKYVVEIKTAADLLIVKPEYYWQCMAHMACINASWCDFIAYCPYQSNPIHIVRVNRDEDAIKKLETRILLANKFLDNNGEIQH